MPIPIKPERERCTEDKQHRLTDSGSFKISLHVFDIVLNLCCGEFLSLSLAMVSLLDAVIFDYYKVTYFNTFGSHVGFT